MDFGGYTDISVQDGKVMIFLDLGNVGAENEKKIIHGILLALNSVEGIKKVVINEK